MDATRTLHQIVCSWLFSRGKTIHTYLKALKLGADAVQELSMTSMPMVHHALLTRETGKPWFNLPKGFSDYTKVAVRSGDSWRPIAIATRLIPFAQFDDTGLGNDLGSDLNAGNNDAGWFGAQASEGGGFSIEDFSGTDMDITPASVAEPITSNATLNGLGLAFNLNGGYTQSRRDAVAFDIKNGRIECYEYFPYDEIYLVYVAVGNVDNMTEIPIAAQAVIEAHMDWKYALNKRKNMPEANAYQQLYFQQHKIYRARRYHWTTVDIKRVFEKRDIGYGIPWYSGYITAGSQNNNTPIVPPATTGIFASQFASQFA